MARGHLFATHLALPARRLAGVNAFIASYCNGRIKALGGVLDTSVTAPSRLCRRLRRTSSNDFSFSFTRTFQIRARRSLQSQKPQCSFRARYSKLERLGRVVFTQLNNGGYCKSGKEMHYGISRRQCMKKETKRRDTNELYWRFCAIKTEHELNLLKFQIYLALVSHA